MQQNDKKNKNAKKRLENKRYVKSKKSSTMTHKTAQTMVKKTSKEESKKRKKRIKCSFSTHEYASNENDKVVTSIRCNHIDVCPRWKNFHFFPVKNN